MIRVAIEGVGDVASECVSCHVEYRLYGGCDTATLRFVQDFETPVIEAGKAITVYHNSLIVFSGRVSICEPDFGRTTQTVKVDGWWKRLNEREAVSPPLLDHITFGQSSDSDHPAITTAFDVFLWIAQNRIYNDPDSNITPGLIESPGVPCKLAGPFVLYAKDNLAQVLETLATMEDCVTGVDANGRLYYLPRVSVESRLLSTVYVKKPIPPNWRSDRIGVPEGSGRFVYDRRGPNSIAVYSRDATNANSIRSYTLKDALPDSTVRTSGIRSANIHTGVQARRYARGLFRRFCDYSVKVEDLTFRSGTQRFEPHLGRVRVEGPSSTVYAEKLCGQISVDIRRSTLVGNVTLGENDADPGSGNPLIDPYAQDPGWNDEPQVDTGLGKGGYPLPSGEIDFDDGWNGDGDDLHQNGDREFPDDLPGSGVPGVDYGSDVRDPDNSGRRSAGGMRLGIITNTSHPTYDVELYEADGSTVAETLTGVPCWPEPVPQLQVGQKVLVMFPDEANPYIDGAIGGRGVKLRIKAVLPANKYEVELLDPYDGETVIGTWTDISPFPISSTFGAGNLVFGYWFNGHTSPTPMGGGSCCGGYFQGHDDLGFAGQTITD